MLFGIIALAIVGVSWSLTGIVMGLAPKKQLEPAVIQLGGAFVSVTASLLIIASTAQQIPDFYAIRWVAASYICAGFINSIGLITMAYVMTKGPNGIIWIIMQSGMIFPFLTGMLFFGVEAKWIRIIGFLMILASLVVFGLFKNNKSAGGKWKLLTFLTFLLTGVVHNLVNLPSYFEIGRSVAPIWRTVFLGSGTLAGAAVAALIRYKEISFKENLKSKYLWIFIGVLQFFNLVCAYTLYYPGMDMMARNGIGSASFPLMVGSCVVAFFLYSITFLREKPSIWQYAATASTIAGIIMICC